MNQGLQGADNALPFDFYRMAIVYIPNGSRVLNLGCGRSFNFEKVLFEEKRAWIESLDILPTKKPLFVKKFLIQDAEKPFLFDKKFDVVTFFELIEHVDKTDVLLKNCFNNLRDGGYLIFSFPNLSSLYVRIELLLGYQPHILEVSNEYGNFGTGIFGKINNKPGGSVHHIRGITYKAMIEMVNYYGFKIIKKIGFNYKFKKLFYFFPSIAPVNIFICQKNI